MLGAIAGDIIGSVYEFAGFKEYDFPLFSDASFFTDDTVLTVATADILMHNLDFAATYKAYALRYPNRGYGGSFYKWIHSDSLAPYYSWGNGSAMRVSPVGFFYESEAEVLTAAFNSAEVTHNHAEGVKGAQATAFAVFMARQDAGKEDIRTAIERAYGYNLSRTLAEIRPGYTFNESCQGSVPEAIIAFLESDDFESAIRNTISLGGDADTLACITGGIAEAYYGQVPDPIAEQAKARLPQEFLQIINEFYMLDS